MGMYTEVYVNVDLKEETPKQVIDALQEICNGITPVGFPARSGSLFLNCSYYTPRTSVGHLAYDEIGKQWSLLGKGDLKNYENEIEYFFNFLMPWVDGFPGDFVGYWRYEEDQAPTLIFIPTQDENSTAGGSDD
jgi:hypothetical protein